jgi:hypothetical protein
MELRNFQVLLYFVLEMQVEEILDNEASGIHNLDAYTFYGVAKFSGFAVPLSRDTS